jgi:hypothetical protein
MPFDSKLDFGGLLYFRQPGGLKSRWFLAWFGSADMNIQKYEPALAIAGALFVGALFWVGLLLFHLDAGGITAPSSISLQPHR